MTQLKCKRNKTHEPRKVLGAKYCQDCGGETYKVLSIPEKATNLLRNTSKDIASCAFILATYPIVGNLSGDLQEKLENKVGKDLFNAVDATALSKFTNLAVYPTILGYLAGIDFSNPYNLLKLYLGGSLGVIVASFFRDSTRNVTTPNNTLLYRGRDRGDWPYQDNIKDIAEGTLLGRLVSQPIKLGLKTFEFIKSYIGEASKND